MGKLDRVGVDESEVLRLQFLRSKSPAPQARKAGLAAIPRTPWSLRISAAISNSISTEWIPNCSSCIPFLTEYTQQRSRSASTAPVRASSTSKTAPLRHSEQNQNDPLERRNERDDADLLRKPSGQLLSLKCCNRGTTPKLNPEEFSLRNAVPQKEEVCRTYSENVFPCCPSCALAALQRSWRQPK